MWRRSAVMLVVLAAAGACVQDDTRMTAGDARAFARQVLEEVGFRDVRVQREVEAGRSDDEPARPAGRGPAVPVWKTVSTVEGGGTAEIWVTQRGSAAVFLRDVGPDGGPLLTEQQVRDLAEFRFNPAGVRARDRVVGPALAASALVVATGTGLAVTARRGARRAA
jgi:hypothetical protein